MKSIIPTYIIIVGFAIIALVSGCLISFQLQLTAARNFHTNCVNRIQSSYYNEQVINDCIGKADDYGYTLTVDDVSIYPDRKDVIVKLDYTASMLFLDVERQGTIESFAK